MNESSSSCEKQNPLLTVTAGKLHQKISVVTKFVMLSKSVIYLDWMTYELDWLPGFDEFYWSTRIRR